MHRAVPLAKRDYSLAREKWEGRRKRANALENTGQTVAGAAGALLGATALREAAFSDHPGLRPKVARVAARGGVRAAAAATHGKPGFKILATGAAGATAAAAGRRSRKIAEKKVDRYSSMSKAAFDEPGGAAHAYDLAIAKGMIRPEANETSVKRHKKVQGVLGTTAAVTGLAAAGTKLAPKIAPKLPKLVQGIGAKGGRAGAYQKHLDKTADSLLFAGAGIGGASGIHQSQIMGAEGRMRKQPVRKGLKRKLVAVGGAAAAGAGSYYALRNPTGTEKPRPLAERTGRTAKKAVRAGKVVATHTGPAAKARAVQSSVDFRRGYQSA